MALSKEINRSLTDKQVDHFYVSFFGIDENASNIMGRQVRRISRPTLSFMTTNRSNKGRAIVEPATVEFQPVDVELADDNYSLATRAIYEQVYKQKKAQNVVDTAFRIGVKVFNVDGEVAEEFTLKQCWIESVSHSEQIYQESTENIITLSVRYVDVDYRFADFDLAAE